MLRQSTFKKERHDQPLILTVRFTVLAFVGPSSFGDINEHQEEHERTLVHRIIWVLSPRTRTSCTKEQKDRHDQPLILTV
jgi:hypothetical protein